MEESGKRRCLKKRSAENAAITQEQMTASQRATQINGRDIHGNLAFNHNNQTPNIAIHFHNGVPASITQSPVSSTSGQTPPTSKTPQPEISRPIPSSSQDELPSPSGSREDVQNHNDTEKLAKASHFVESGLEQERTSGGEKGIKLHSRDSVSKESTSLVNDGHREQIHRRQVVRRRKLGGFGFMIVVILVIAGIVTGVTISERKHNHPAASALSSTFAQIASNTTGIGTASSGQNSGHTNTSQMLANTSRSSQQIKTTAESTALKVPTSNTASTTSDQTLSTSYTPATPASTCTANCQASTTPSSTTVPATSAKSDVTSQAPAIILPTTPTTTPKPTSSSKPVSCTTDTQCSGGQQCDYSASTCQFCTYATLGERCSGNQYNCCDPWKCIVGNDAYSTCVYVS